MPSTRQILDIAMVLHASEDSSAQMVDASRTNPVTSWMSVRIGLGFCAGLDADESRCPQSGVPTASREARQFGSCRVVVAIFAAAPCLSQIGPRSQPSSLDCKSGIRRDAKGIR
jgi:hypothetical protein